MHKQSFTKSCCRLDFNCYVTGGCDQCRGSSASANSRWCTWIKASNHYVFCSMSRPHYGSSSLLVSLITAYMDKIDQWLLGTIGWCIHMIGDCDYCWSCYLQQVIGRWDQCIGSTASKQFIGQLIPVGQRSWWSTRINASNHYGYRGGTVTTEEVPWLMFNIQ